MRQSCTVIAFALLGALACSKAPTAPTGELTLQARNQTTSTLFVSLTNMKTLQKPLLGQVGPATSACYALPSFADSSYLTVYDGAGTIGQTVPFIPTLSGSWQLSIVPGGSPNSLTAQVSAGVACTP